ncbi:tellurium resistance protein [Cellulomonas sp. JH27-2]|uniref:TerD family protein n=1 Tax=Cellulomonas sp. JH27-2 TaxID=2774139 RepID=UPI0017873D16|nr:tellurium resistance protein [Cellulomonas sp. JH27-2]MBD8059652.1 tellurium resistance protein [Cellulomonas sp. JH27-2]
MGIDYTKRPKSAPDAPLNASSATQPVPQPSPQAAPQPPEPRVTLGKVTLTKAAPTVSLSKADAASGVLRVNLNWTARPPASGGFWKSLAGAPAIDLDLACLYEYTDGSKGVVQALGNAFRDEHTFGPEPICWLDGDDRTGTRTGGENLFVDLRHIQAVRRILVFAFIYEGVPNWAAADAVVTLFPRSGPQIEVRLDESDPQSPSCAIALLENVGGELSVRREVRYVRGGQSAVDAAYGWGMQWARGCK